MTGSHSMKFGYQGNFWRDDREMHVNNQDLGYLAVTRSLGPGCADSVHHSEYVNRYNVNARAMQSSLLRAGPVDDQSPHAAGRDSL